MSIVQQPYLHDLQLCKSTPLAARSKAWIYASRLLRLESLLRHCCLFLADVVCCQVEVPVSG